jgi:signal transduction histidine kinase
MTAKAQESKETFEYVTQHLLRHVAHDIRSPAGVIRNALEEVALSETSEERQTMIAMADRGLERLLRLADRLSMVCEIQRGVSFDRQPLDLRALLEGATDHAAKLQGRRNVRIVREFGAQTLHLSADARWLSAALSEVIANALRYARSQVRVVLLLTDNGVDIVVEDDGPGFAPNFDVADTFRVRESVQGLGLSLALAADVCIGHKGSLRVHASTLAPVRAGSIGAAVTLELGR